MAKKVKPPAKLPESAKYLKSYQTLCAQVASFDEETTKELLELERTGKRRFGILNRLYGRWNVLRTERERNELFGGK